MMQRINVEPKAVVYEIECDRCGKEVQRDGSDFELMTSIGFQARYASIFGDGNRVEIDLCEPCLRDTLGTWLRVMTPEHTPLAGMQDKFEPEVHGGEFPATADSTFVPPEDIPVQERMPIDAEMPEAERRAGAFAGRLEVPGDFDAPLPAEVLQNFERSADNAQVVLDALDARIAEGNGTIADLAEHSVIRNLRRDLKAWLQATRDYNEALKQQLMRTNARIS